MRYSTYSVRKYTLLSILLENMLRMETLPLPNENIATSERKHCCFRMKILPLLTVHRGTAPTSHCHYFSFVTFALGFTKVQGSPLDPSTGAFFFFGYIFYSLSISYTIIDFSGIRWMSIEQCTEFLKRC